MSWAVQDAALALQVLLIDCAALSLEVQLNVMSLLNAVVVTCCRLAAHALCQPWSGMLTSNLCGCVMGEQRC